MMRQFGSGLVDRIKGVIITAVRRNSISTVCGGINVGNGSNYYYRFTRHAMIHEYEYENKGALL